MSDTAYPPSDSEEPMWCGYCNGAVIDNPDGPGYVHADSGDRVKPNGPGDLVSGLHNRAGTRVNPVDIVEARPTN